ncbi:hypothetical protein LCGC14_2407280 [marine sediment metagenome]|uniref:Peptidase M15C domain-containing protein n=1 Tax=marine sediment metagenome TaxID=412755 RepID=A0A0F9BTG9_9ZZZZ
MPEFSVRSEGILLTCDPKLQVLFLEVVKTFDCTVVSGHRDEDKQNSLLHRGLSKLRWPHSLHNREPSLAVDVYPYPIDWQDRERFHYFAGFVMGAADGFKYKIRWGGDWNKDWQVRDNVFDDLGHFELIG